MAYIWQHKQWPDLRWDDQALAKLLTHVSREQGRLLGKMEGLGFNLRDEAHLRTLTEG
jgi:Fic family protein